MAGAIEHMTRLPQPGADNNSWGDILNDFLLTSHNSDGTLKSGSVSKTQLGLDNVDNTSDLNKPVSTATQTSLDNKVTKNNAIIGATKTKISYDSKGLVTAGADATQDDIADGATYKQYSATEKTKLANIEDNADVTDAANVAAAGAEMVANRVSSFQVTPDDAHYPTEKLVKDSIDAIGFDSGDNLDVLQFRGDPVAVVAATEPPGGAGLVVVDSSNNTISVTASHDGATVYSRTYTIPSATYPASLGALSAIPVSGEFRFSTVAGRAKVYLFQGIQPNQVGYTVTVTGGTALSFLGFSAGQSATYSASANKWTGTAPSDLYEVSQLESRMAVVESAVATPPVIGNGLRQLIIPGTWLAAPSGPPGTAALGKTTATEIVKVSPVFITRTVTITEFAYEISTAPVASNDYYVVLYSDAGLAYDWPGALVHRELIPSSAAITTKSATLSTPISLVPGTYYLGIGLAGATIEDSTIRLITTTACGVLPGISAAGIGPGSGGRAPAGIIATWSDPTGPFPGPSATGVGTQAAVPRAYMRVSF